MKSAKIIVFALVVLLMSLSKASAVELFEGAWRGLDADFEEIEGAVLGVGALYSVSPYRGVDDNVAAVPIIVGKYKNLYSDGTSLGFILNDNEEVYFSIVGQPRFSGYDSDDSSFLNGMQDREWTIDGGLRLTWNNDLFLMNLTGITDLLSEHDGQQVGIVFSKEFFDGGITPRVGVKWLSDNLVEHYYGVAGTEATATRSSYEGGATVDYIAGFSVGIPLDDAWAIFGDFEYEKLGDEITDSPIVEEDNMFTYMLGAAYRF